MGAPGRAAGQGARVSRRAAAGVVCSRGSAMDLNDYLAGKMIAQRHAELTAAARNAALARAGARPRRPLRVALGTLLIRAGARLLREHYAAPHATHAGG